VTFWPSEEGHKVAKGSPELVAEAVLDVASLVGVGVNWLTTEESVVEVSWVETVLSEAVLDPAKTLLEFDTVVWEASELVEMELVLDTASLVGVDVDRLTMDESVIEADWLGMVLLSTVLEPAETLLELESVVTEISELIVEVALSLEVEPVDNTLTEDVPTSAEEDWEETSWDWVETADAELGDAVLSMKDDWVDEASIVDEVALSLIEDWNDETSVVDDDAAGWVDSVEEKFVDDEVWDTSTLDVMSDEEATAESELVVIEASEDDWVVAPGELEAGSEVLPTSEFDARSLEVTVSLEDWTGSDASLVTEADTLAGALSLDTAVLLAAFRLALKADT
jgi:hypothetical protein